MKITCDVIQDLMPSYIDGILSEDSKVLVEEHIGTCQECRKMKEEQGKEQDRIRSSVASITGCGAGRTENTESNSNTGSVSALKKIRKKLLLRRVLTAAVAVILTLIAAAAGYNHWYFNEKYMTLEDSGISVFFQQSY